MPAVRPVKVRSIVPVAPVTAVAGAVTVMLPAAVLPSTHVNSVNVALGPPVAKGATTTV